MTNAPARRRLLDAAKRLLWERGFEATSPRAVLTESGVGHGSLYHHFPSKKALAEAALEETANDLIASAEAVLADPAPAPLDRVRHWLTRPRPGLRGCRLGRLAGEPEVFDAVLHAPLERYFSRVHDLVAGCLREAKALGHLPADLDDSAVATALVAVIQGGFVISRSRGDGDEINRATAGAMALLDQLAGTQSLTARK